jgi:hypothetical protein
MWKEEDRKTKDIAFKRVFETVKNWLCIILFPFLLYLENILFLATLRIKYDFLTVWDLWDSQCEKIVFYRDVLRKENFLTIKEKNKMILSSPFYTSWNSLLNYIFFAFISLFFHTFSLKIFIYRHLFIFVYKDLIF